MMVRVRRSFGETPEHGPFDLLPAWLKGSLRRRPPMGNSVA
jgi:hypothetical protein